MNIFECQQQQQEERKESVCVNENSQLPVMHEEWNIRDSLPFPFVPQAGKHRAAVMRISATVVRGRYRTFNMGRDDGEREESGGRGERGGGVVRQ